MRSPDDPVMHLDRARMFLEHAVSARAPHSHSALLVAAVYSGVAYYENIADACEQGKLKTPKARARELFKESVPYFTLLEYIRLHDFHRRPFHLEPGLRGWMGPARLKATQAGSIATLMPNESGVTVGFTVRNASVKQNKPLSYQDYFVSDPETDTMVDIHQAIDAYLTGALLIWPRVVDG